MSNSVENSSVRHAVFVNRFSGGLSKDFLPVLEALKKLMRDRITRSSTIPNQRSLIALIRDLTSIQTKVYSDYEKGLLAELRVFVGHEAGFESALLGKAADREINRAIVLWGEILKTPLVLNSQRASTILNSFIKDWSKAEIKRVSQLIRFGFDEGQTVEQMAKLVGGNLNKKTLANNRAIVRTAVNHTSTVSRLSVASQNKNITSGYRITAALDGRTSDFCKGIDGTVVKWSDKVKPMPPFHPNCRTTTVPMLDDRLGLNDVGGTRKGSGAASNRVKLETNYYSWLKNQSNQPGGRRFVMETLGAKRGKLFLNGGLSADEFRKLTTDELFRPIPLDELRKKDSLSNAFDDAGM